MILIWVELFSYRLPKFKAAIRKEMKKLWRFIVPQRCLRSSGNKTKVEISSEGQISKHQNGEILHAADTLHEQILLGDNNSPRPAFHLVFQSGSIRTMKATDKCTQTTSV